ncbi:MAG: hypothetical protein KGL11_07190 [Alphaproteobacteria bacterium]|nr:hypothetical protein [Alphaproteobacteria bacterium]
MQLRLRQRLARLWPLWLALLAARLAETRLGTPLHGIGISGIVALAAFGLLIVKSYRATASRA